MYIKTILACAALVGALAAAPAHAGTARVSADVDYSDLDLAQPEGVAALEQRVQVAVRHMCGSYERRDGMGERPLKRCTQAARLDPQIASLVARAKAEQATLAAK